MKLLQHIRAENIISGFASNILLPVQLFYSY